MTTRLYLDIELVCVCLWSFDIEMKVAIEMAASKAKVVAFKEIVQELYGGIMSNQVQQ